MSETGGKIWIAIFAHKQTTYMYVGTLVGGLEGLVGGICGRRRRTNDDGVCLTDERGLTTSD
jgi:hypothetical protein